jgi:hypothetical protein
MPKQITWAEPNRPEIPNGWPIIIDGQNGTAYEDVSEYVQAVATLEASQTPNTPPNE